MQDIYSPHTGEHINTDSPAPWMVRAGVPAPEYNPQTQGCFWRGQAWEVVAANPVVEVRDYQHFAPLDFLALFAPERRAIKAAAMVDVDIGIWYDDTVAARYVSFSDPRTQHGLTALIQAGLLTQERHDQIVATLTAEREG